MGVWLLHRHDGLKGLFMCCVTKTLFAWIVQELGFKLQSVLTSSGCLGKVQWSRPLKSSSWNVYIGWCQDHSGIQGPLAVFLLSSFVSSTYYCNSVEAYSHSFVRKYHSQGTHSCRSRHDGQYLVQVSGCCLFCWCQYACLLLGGASFWLTANSLIK